jgi:5-methylcytosine-specific restriction endonuclease McrA
MPSQIKRKQYCSSACMIKRVEITCKICGANKVVPFHKIKEGKGKFCSVACYNEHKKTPEHQEKIKNSVAAICAYGRSRRGVKLNNHERLKVSTGLKLAYARGTFHGFTGKHHTETEKLRRSLARLGKPNPAIAGPKSHFWGGGVTPANHKIRNSLEYKNWRRGVFERDDFTCQDCGQRGGDLEADHIKPFALFPELRFIISNGRTLCSPCHIRTETWGNGTRKFMTLP